MLPGGFGDAAAGSAAAAHVDPARGAGITRHSEWLQILGGQVQHPHNPRGQREDDVGFLGFPLVMAEEPADHRDIAEAGTAANDSRSSSRIKPASMLVSPSFRRITVLIERLPNVGQPAEPRPRNAAQLHL